MEKKAGYVLESTGSAYINRGVRTHVSASEYVLTSIYTVNRDYL